MLNIEKTLQSVRDLLDRLGKEGVEFALVESEYSDYVADIRNPNKVYVFLECSIRPNGTFVWRDYDHHKGVCDFDEFRVRIITLTANKYLDKAKGKRKQWASLCDGTDTPMPESLFRRRIRHGRQGGPSESVAGTRRPAPVGRAGHRNPERA